MSLNWVSFDDRGAVVPLPKESLMQNVEKVELNLAIPQPAAGSSSSSTHKELKENGMLYLTTQRLYFIPANGPTASFKSFSVPLISLLSTRFIQPVFGANYLALDIKPVPNGGLNAGTRAEIRFSTKGLIDFAAVVEKAQQRALYERRDEMMGEALPIYNSPDDVPDSSVAIDDLPPPPDAEDSHPAASPRAHISGAPSPPPPPAGDLPPAYF